MQAKICNLANRRFLRNPHNAWVDYAKWLKGEFTRTGKAKAGLARVLGRSEGAVSRLLKGRRQLKADEFEKARAYFSTAPDESNVSSINTAQNGQHQEEREAQVQEVIEHIHEMIEEYGREVVRKAFIRAFKPQVGQRATRP